MLFDPRIVEAKLALGRVHPEEMPGIAADALEAGFDGPAIRRVAALDAPSGWEVDQLTSRFMAETSMHLLPKGEAAALVAYDLARHIIDQRKDPLLFVDEFFDLWISSDYVREIQTLGLMKDEVYLSGQFGKSEAQIRNDLRDELIEFLRNMKL